jgi:Holliday junction DNA helicase RuvB
VGIGTLATSVSEDAGTLEEVYEPFLIKEGFIVRTQRGRVATDLAYSHLGMEAYMNQRKYSLDESGSLF